MASWHDCLLWVQFTRRVLGIREQHSRQEGRIEVARDWRSVEGVKEDEEYYIKDDKDTRLSCLYMAPSHCPFLQPCIPLFPSLPLLTIFSPLFLRLLLVCFFLSLSPPPQSLSFFSTLSFVSFSSSFLSLPAPSLLVALLSFSSCSHSLSSGVLYDT